MLKDEYIVCRNRLREGGIPDAGFEAVCIIEHATGCGRAAQIAHGDRAVTDAEKAVIDHITEERLKRFPLQYLLGTRQFFGFDFAVGEGVLIPRDDTEVAVGLCLDYLKDKGGAKAVDLCAGSGAIAVALSKLTAAEVTAVELSDKAFYFLEKNIKDNGTAVKAIKGDVFTCHSGFADASLDLIVSNPPYIKRGELPGLQAEVLHEPKMALDGGESGLDFYRAITRDWSRKLKNGGALVFELGEEQADDVARMMTAQGFVNIRCENDIGGTQRAIIGTMLRK